MLLQMLALTQALALARTKVDHICLLVCACCNVF